MPATTNFLIPNATVFVEIGVFAAVLGVVARFVLPPLQAAMNHRQEEVRTAIETTQQARQLLETAEFEYETKLNDARRQASVIIESGRRVSAHIQAEARQQAKEEHDRIVTQARRYIDRAAAASRDQLQQGARGISTDVVTSAVRVDTPPRL